MVVQCYHLHKLRGRRDINPTMGPTILGALSERQQTSQTRAFARIYVPTTWKIHGATISGLPITGRFRAPIPHLLLRGSYCLNLPHRQKIDIQVLGPRIYLTLLPRVRNRDGFAILFL